MSIKSSPPKQQQGVMLLEALIGILIFTVGILGLIGLQAVATNAVSDSKYRGDAAFLANQILSEMWVSNPANLSTFQTNPNGSGCSFSGTSSITNTTVSNWIGASNKAGTVLGSLPGTSTSTQQIKVGADNTVSVTLCWRLPSASAFHSLTIASQINGTAP